MQEFCEQGCYWSDCEHRVSPGERAREAPPAGARWAMRAGRRVAVKESAPPGLERAVDDYIGELLPLAGRPWSMR